MKYFGIAVAACMLLLIGCKGSDLVSVHDGTPKVTKAQFDQIKTGMTLKEVEGIIGGSCTVQSESGDAVTPLHPDM